MGNTVSRITNTGNYLVNGSFDEWTGAPVVDNSLLMWLDPGQPTSYNGNGTTWTDLSGKGYSGTLINNPTFSDTTGFTLNGSNQYVNVPAITSSMLANGFTWAGWVKTTAFASSWMWPFSTSTGNWLQLGKISGTGGIRFDSAGTFYTGGSLDATGVNIADGNWHYLVGTWDTQNRYIYFDGTFQVSTASTPGTNQSAWGNMILGCHPGPAEFWNGQLGIMKIYNRALSATEIQKNYNALAPRYGLTPIANVSSQIRTTPSTILARGLDEITKPIINDSSLVLYLDAGRTDSYSGTGNTWIDLSGNANNGAMINVPVYNAANSGYFIFNGANTAFQVNRPVQDDFTISFWFNTTSNNGTPGSWYNGMGLVDCEVGGVVNDYGTSIGQGKVMFGVGNPDTTIISTNTYNNGAWHHVTATRIKSTGAMALYIDAVLVGTVTGGTNSQTAATYMRIGSIQLGAPYFNGSISAVQVYNRALISTEIQQNYNAFAPRYNLPTISPVVAKRELTTGTVQVAGNFDEWTGAPIADSSLVLWLDAGQPASYNGSGTIWTDLSGKGNNGTLYNISYNSSLVGGSVLFNGSNSYVNCGTFVTAVNIQTISVWVKFNDLVNAQEIVSKSAGSTGVELLLYSNALQTYVMGAGTPTQTNIGYSVSNLNTSSWYNIVATQAGNGGAMNLYVNGTVIASGTAPTTINDSTNLLIGTWNGGGRFFNGSISQIQIYNRALSAQEIQQNFNALRGRYGI